MTQDRGPGEVLLRLAFVTQRHYAQICAEHDLTPAQATVLCILKDHPRRMADLAAALGMAKNALSQLVDRIERRGLVHRESPCHDRRVITLSLTPSGAEVAEAVSADVDGRLPDIAAHLSPDDQDALQRLAAAVAARHVPGASCPSDAQPPTA